jgi:endonuclease-3
LAPPKRDASLRIAYNPPMGNPPNHAATHRARRILERLAKVHPDADCELQARNAFELLVATILSAQCTDARVNAVTPELFQSFPNPEALAGADLASVEVIVRPTGFFRSKARSVVACCRALVDRHAGQVPCTMADLVKLPGVGRKTANVVLSHACGVTAGIVVDTHVKRVARRLGLTQRDDPEEIEADLQALFPKARWTQLGNTLIFHGRRVCHAHKPNCGTCPVASVCPSREDSARRATPQRR